MATLQLKDINKIYPNGVQAVFDFNLSIKDKEFIVFVGPSGCGKSTTLRMIAGLEEITSGELYIDEEMVNDKAPKDRNIAMVFQSYALYPHMSVYDNMAFGLKLRKMPKDQIEEKVNQAAEILGLSPYLDRKPKALSGGQRQRVALGRAIVRNAKVFLMDEPLSNLDAKLRVQMRGELIKLHNQIETTTIYVTHDQIEAMTMASRIVVMKDGYIMQVGSPKEIYDNPNNMFVASFVGSPAMSLIPLELVSEAGHFSLKSPEGWSLTLSDENSRRANAARSNKLVLGARHSTIRLYTEAQPDAIPGRVYTVEPTGDITFVQVYLGDAVVIVSLDPTIEIEPDTQVWLEFDQERLHLFDGETEMALSSN